MDRHFAYQSIQNFMKRNFWKLWLGLLMISLINGLMTMVFGKTITNSFITFEFGTTNNSIFGFDNTLQNDVINTNFLANVFQTTIGIFLNSGFIFAVMFAFQNNRYFRVLSIFNQLRISTLNTLIVCVVISVATYFLAFIPFLGMILSLMLTYSSYILILTVHEKNINILLAYKDIFRMFMVTKGSVFIVLMRYLLILILGLICCLMLITFGSFGIILSLIGSVTVFLKFYPRIYVAISVCYAIVNREEKDIRYTV